MLVRCRLLVIFALFVGGASACLQYSTDSRGNLKSVGIPGVPVWPAKQDTKRAQLESNVAGSAQWLTRLNTWRVSVGTVPVGENTELSYGCVQHSRYLVQGGPQHDFEFAQYAAGLGGAAHEEDPRSPLYTREGRYAAIGGHLSDEVLQAGDVAWASQSEQEDIDKLLVAPFHRLSLLAPWAKVAGYGSFGTFPRSAATVALRGPSKDAGVGQIQFPAAGSTVPIISMTQPEWPSPLASCPGYQLPIGLPITMQLGTDLSTGLTSYFLEDQTENRRLESCAFDAVTYNNPSLETQQHGREGLKGFGAIVMIPRYPLQPGHTYRVSISAVAQNFEWTFSTTRGAQPQKGAQISGPLAPQ
ncbi:MAG: hypothetical protein ACREUQ_13370 [Burkholderiales bacterium]